MPVLANRPTALAEPEPARRAGIPEEWSIKFDIPIDARRTPIWEHGKMQATLLGLLGGDPREPRFLLKRRRVKKVWALPQFSLLE